MAIVVVACVDVLSDAEFCFKVPALLFSCQMPKT